MIPADKKYIVNPDILCEKEIDGMLLFDPHSGEVKILNETGAFVYELFQHGSDFPAALTRICEVFDDCDPLTVEKDLMELVGQMCRAGLIREITQEAGK